MVTKIYKGDSTNANGRTIQINLPDQDFDGLSIVFEFLGKKFIEESPERGGSIRCDFTAEETARMPLGTHFARLGIVRNGIEYTASATIPICVSDSVGDVYGGDASNINLVTRLCSGIPDLTDIDHAPQNSNALAAAFRALLEKLQSGVCLSIALFCAACAGADPATAPIGEIPFTQQIVTNQTESFAPMSHAENRQNPHGVTAAQIGAVKTSGASVIFGEDHPYSQPEEAELVLSGLGVGGGSLSLRSGAMSNGASLSLMGYYNGGELLSPASITKDGVEVATVDDLNIMSNSLASAIVGSGGLTPEMATNVARAVAQPHIDSRNNPHGVTASQVGAIPQNLNSPYTISLGEFPLFFSSTVGGSESPEMSVSSDGVWISGLNVDGQLVKGGDDVATVPFVLSASNNLARVRLDIVLQTYPTQHYEIQRNGVKQTFDQVAELASSRDCYIKRANGIYHPTYISAAEVMFDCVGTIQGLIETRRIHMVASTGAVTIGDLKVVADRDWVESLPTTYTNFSGTAFVALNQSVQTITTHGEQITITMPNAVTGGTRDFCVYINNEGSTDSPLWLPSGTYYGDEDCTNAVKSGIVTALYFTEMSGGKFMLGRRELAQISVSH